jgi:hypothetical protein
MSRLAIGTAAVLVVVAASSYVVSAFRRTSYYVVSAFRRTEGARPPVTA